MSKKIALALAVATLTGATCAAAQEGPLQVRVRAVQLSASNSDSANVGLSINNKMIPEADISYFITDNIAAELILTVPQKHDVKLNGAVIGSLKHLPPTLTVQYHFAPKDSVRPYVGAGLNYTHFSSVNLPAGLSVKSNSYGAAFQAGVDVQIDKTMFANFDVKKVYIGTDVSANGAKLTTFKVNPTLIGVGLGWRF